jgi:hypothetical protein
MGQALGKAGAVAGGAPDSSGTISPETLANDPMMQDRLKRLAENKLQTGVADYKAATEQRFKDLGQQAKQGVEPIIDPFRRIGMAGKWTADRVKGFASGLRNPGQAIPKQLTRSANDLAMNLNKAGSDIKAEAGRAGESIKRGLGSLKKKFKF